MAQVVVLSTPSQYRRLLHEGIDPKEFEVWCDDERYYGFFEKKGVPFKKLEEDLVAEHWEKINTWSCETVAKWVAFCRRYQIFDEIDWASVICVVHGYLLAPLLRSYHLAKFLMEKTRYERILVFSGYARKDYPQFSGNDYLNGFLKLECERLGVPATEINLEGGKNGKNWQPETRGYLQATLFPLLKRLINKAYGFFVKPAEGFDVLAFGSLRHLGSTVHELKQRGVKVALYDFEFHRDQWVFSLGERLPYLLPECFPKKTVIDPETYAKRIAEGFNRSFKLAEGTDLFVYDGMDLREFVQTRLFGSMQAYFQRSAESINHYKNLSSVCRVKSVLVEDDFAIKGGVFAGYFNSIGTRVFCISHANFAVNARVSEENCHFHQSYTFVNSEFEKANYIRRGWEPSHLIVTGAPRYDRLVSLKGEKGNGGKNEKYRILFCGTGLWSFSPDVYSYVGHQKECFGDVQFPVLRAVCSAIKDSPIDLVIKPHSFEMIPLWKELIRQTDVDKQIILKKHSDDIFRLLMECDAMILAYWSTTIIESAIAKKPTIYVDFRKTKSPVLYEYADNGFCHLVNSEAALKEAIRKVFNRGDSFFAQEVPVERKQYYLGPCDRQASKRVSDFIMGQLSSRESAIDDSFQKIPLRA